MSIFYFAIKRNALIRNHTFQTLCCRVGSFFRKLLQKKSEWMKITFEMCQKIGMSLLLCDLYSFVSCPQFFVVIQFFLYLYRIGVCASTNDIWSCVNWCRFSNWIESNAWHRNKDFIYLTVICCIFIVSVHIFAKGGPEGSNSTTMDTNNPGSTNSIWQNHCNGSSGSSSSGTSQSSPISMSDSNEQQQQPTTRKKTWSELKESVTELRKQLSRLSTMVPMNIQFRKLSDSRIRIYFLGMWHGLTAPCSFHRNFWISILLFFPSTWSQIGTPPNGWETTLLCTDITPAMLSANTPDEHLQQHHTRFDVCFYFISHILPFLRQLHWFLYIDFHFIILLNLEICVNRIGCNGNSYSNHRYRIWHRAAHMRVHFSYFWSESDYQHLASHRMNCIKRVVAWFFLHRVRCFSA